MSDRAQRLAVNGLARAIRGHAHDVADAKPGRPRYAAIKQLSPLVLTLYGTKVDLREEDGDLILSQGLRRYDQDVGLTTSDTVAVLQMPDQEWLALDVVGPAPINAMPISAIDRTWFGDGFDGSVVLTGNLTLARDVYYEDLDTAGFAINTGLFRLFVRGTLTVRAATVISAPDGATAVLNAVSAPTNLGGGLGQSANANAGGDPTPSVFMGGQGGAGGAGAAGANAGGPGTGGTARDAGARPRLPVQQVLLQSPESFGSPAKTLVAGRGGSSGGGGAINGVNGGAGGNGGGFVCVFARDVAIEAGATLRARGGTGGSGSGGNAGGGGGGGGGAGLLMYRTKTGAFTTDFTGGAGGAGASGGATGSTGQTSTLVHELIV